jgi:hypothetical protein
MPARAGCWRRPSGGAQGGPKLARADEDLPTLGSHPIQATLYIIKLMHFVLASYLLCACSVNTHTAKAAKTVSAPRPLPLPLPTPSQVRPRLPLERHKVHCNVRGLLHAGPQHRAWQCKLGLSARGADLRPPFAAAAASPAASPPTPHSHIANASLPAATAVQLQHDYLIITNHTTCCFLLCR